MMHYLFRSKKTKQDDLVVTVDAGDWYSGSLFDHLGADIRTSSVPQMQFFHAAQYDAIVLGNHDFDRYETALFSMLDKAQKLNLMINVIVSNLEPLAADSKFQQFYLSASSVKFIPYLIKENSHGKVGVLGYITPDALFVSNDYRDDLQFVGYSQKERSQYNKLLALAVEQSTMLKKELKCDIVVVVIHGGHKDKEDVGFLNLPNVDVVLGGHTHETYLYGSDDSSLSSQCGYAGIELTALSIGMDDAKKVHFRGVNEEYKLFVDEKSPQCIKVGSEFKSDVDFEQKIQVWKSEINDLLSVDMDEVVFKGNLSSLLQLSMTHEEMGISFAHMLVSEFNKWEAKNKPVQSDPVIATFWNREFFEKDELTHPLSDLTMTYDDAYNLIFFPALKDLYTFYLKKEELYYILQGAFIISNLISPLLFIDAGGIVYRETSYLGVPLVTDIKTIDGVPYSDWPPMVRVLANSISAPYLWKIDKFSKGFLDNFPKNKVGRPILMDEAFETNSPKELDLFLNYLKRLSEI